MNKQLFNEYADLKRQERDIASRIEELAPLLLSEIETAEVERVQSEAGTFTKGKRKNWTFTEKVKSAESAVKELKKIECADGSATFEEKSYLIFKESVADIIEEKIRDEISQE